MSRTVAIVGRPNVGKSALFNRLAGRRISIVHDQPGVTRDRLVAECRLGDAPFMVVDTGGIGSEVDASFTEKVRAEADIAIGTADVIVFVVDGQAGLTPVDAELADMLRRSRKPLILAVNKVDHVKHDDFDSDFQKLGLDPMIPISAEHARGMNDLLAAIEARLPSAADEAEKADDKPVAIAVVGRPNVGKSSLLNAILQDPRAIVSPISGTTRDAVDIPYTRRDQSYVLIDTAGIRPRGKQDSSVEVFSVMRSERSIRRADLCVLVLDVTAGFTAQDKKIAGLIQQAQKPCVLVANKSDLLEPGPLRDTLDELRTELFFLDYAPLILLSAKTRHHVPRLFRAIDDVAAAARERIGTGPLNRMLKEAVAQQPPPAARGGRRLKILYGTQADARRTGAIQPPTIVLFVNEGELLTQTYRRFLEARIREISPFTGSPLLLELRGREKRRAK